MSLVRQLRRALAGAAAGASVAAAAGAQADSAPPPAPSLAIAAEAQALTPAWSATAWQASDATLVLSLARPPRDGDGHLAILVGQSDLSAIATVDGRTVSLPLRGQPIAAGDVIVEAYLVTPDGTWRPLGSFPLRRLTPAGFEAVGANPSLDAQSDGQVAARRVDGADASSGAASWRDVTMNGGVDAVIRRAGWDLGAKATLLGATRATARLRAAQLGRDAPAVDLASYEAHLTRGPLTLGAGHLTVGADRYLATGFRSRGVSAAFSPGSALRLAVAEVAGAEPVGWANAFGLAHGEHRVTAATASVEALPWRPGLLHVDITALDGARGPVAGFTQGAVTDRERSRGAGAQLVASDPTQRARLTIGAAWSRFTNPRDPALGDSVVPVRAETRRARFAELSVDVLRGAHVGPVPLALSVAARRERVDPLYRSVAAQVQADRDASGVDVNATVDALQLGLGGTSGRDNLADIPSLLTTHLRSRSARAALPLALLLRQAAHAGWWPTLTASWDANWQVGDSAPPNGGFRFAFQVPDQRTDDVQAGAAWQVGTWSLGYHVDHATTDNRQPDRERADLASTAHGVTLGMSPLSSLTLAVDWSAQRQASREDHVRTANARLGLQGDWRPLRRSTLSAAWSTSTAHGGSATPRSRNDELRLEASQGFDVFARSSADASQARLFLRYARTAARLRGALDGAPRPVSPMWNVSGGLSLRVL